MLVLLGLPPSRRELRAACMSVSSYIVGTLLSIVDVVATQLKVFVLFLANDCLVQYKTRSAPQDFVSDGRTRIYARTIRVLESSSQVISLQIWPLCIVH